MDEAVWKFPQFERLSLGYPGTDETPSNVVDGWTSVRDERLAALIDQGILMPGTDLIGQQGEVAIVTEDYGISLGGIRCDSPDAAAEEVVGADNGWAYWSADTRYGQGTLEELLTFVSVGQAATR